MLPYIILSYVIIKNLLYTTTLLLFYIIIPMLNKLNLLFNNNIQLNITLINGVQNNNTKEKTIINIKNTSVEDEDNTEELELTEDEENTEEIDSTEDEENTKENDSTEDEEDKVTNKTEDKVADKTEDKVTHKTEDKVADKTEDKIADKTEDKVADKKLLKETKPYSFFDYFFARTNKFKNVNDEDIILVDETI
jgi:cell division protein FtsX